MLNLTQVKGNTYVMEGCELIPLYRMDDGRCILLDSGLVQERQDIEDTLRHYGLTPVAILCSHAHVDHGGNNRYFQENYGTTVALTAPEAGITNSILNLKTYRTVVSPAVVFTEMSEMVHQADVVLPAEDCSITLAGVEFSVLFTPGHSCGHICTITPDDVCYTGDALMSKELMEAKLPYGLAIAMMLESQQKIRSLTCSHFIMAHTGICTLEEFPDLVDANRALLLRCAKNIRDVVTEDMHFSELCHRVSEVLNLHSDVAGRVLCYERNIRLFLEFLTDMGDLTMIARDGVVMFRQSSALKL